MGAMLVPGLLYFNPRSREGSDSTMIHLMTNI